MTADLSKPHCYTCGHNVGTPHSEGCPRRRWYADGIVRERDRSWETSEAPRPLTLRPALVGQRSRDDLRAELIEVIETEGSRLERLWLPLLRLAHRWATR